MERPHGTKDEYEEHGAKNEGCHTHSLADFAVREQERLPVAARAFKAVFDVVVHVDGVGRHERCQRHCPRNR